MSLSVCFPAWNMEVRQRPSLGHSVASKPGVECSLGEDACFIYSMCVFIYIWLSTKHCTRQVVSFQRAWCLTVNNSTWEATNWDLYLLLRWSKSVGWGVCALFIRSLIHYLVLQTELDNTVQPQFSNLICSRELFQKCFVRTLNPLCHVTDHTGTSTKGWQGIESRPEVLLANRDMFSMSNSARTKLFKNRDVRELRFDYESMYAYTEQGAGAYTLTLPP